MTHPKMPALPMPPLPKAPATPAGKWRTASATQDPNAAQQHAGARVVQHHFVRAQLQQINTHGSSALHAETFKALRAHVPGLATATDAQLLQVFDKMTKRLQKARLTINFNAASWFSTPNTYETYTQMYERAASNVVAPDGVKRLNPIVLKNDKHNTATVRDEADTNATFGSNMRGADGKFKAGVGGIGRMMDTGGLSAIDAANPSKGFLANNKHFNPHTRQIFAAVDYGERPHGACIEYGYSFLSLSERFKTNALFFAGDTFFATSAATSSPAAPTLGRVFANNQVSFNLLGALFGFAGNSLRPELERSCIQGMQLKDPARAQATSLLVEAHLFEGLSFRGGVDKLYLSLRDDKGHPLDKGDAKVIKHHAEQFCKRNGIKLRLKD